MKRCELTYLFNNLHRSNGKMFKISNNIVFFINVDLFPVIFRKESRKISNDQELIQSDPISCPQNQKRNN